LWWAPAIWNRFGSQSGNYPLPGYIADEPKIEEAHGNFTGKPLDPAVASQFGRASELMRGAGKRASGSAPLAITTRVNYRQLKPTASQATHETTTSTLALESPHRALKNYLRTDMISRRRQSAGRTIVPPIGEGFRHGCPAQTFLRTTPWVHLGIPPASICRLVGDECKELTPSGIVNGLRQHPAGEPFHMQIFGGYHAVLVDQLARFFVVEIAALVRYMGMRPWQQEDGLTAAVASLFAPRHLPLSATEARFGIPVVARIRNLRAAGKHRKAVPSNVNPSLERTRGAAERNYAQR
jgi:hypothetical protein